MARPAKRKHVEEVAPAAGQITNYTRIQKNQVPTIDAKEKGQLGSTITHATLSNSKKRKATSTDDSATQEIINRRTVSFAPSSDEEGEALSKKRACRRSEPQTTTIVSRVSEEQVQTVPAAQKGKRVAKAPSSRKGTAHKPVESTIIAASRRGGKTIQTKIDTAFRPRAATKKEVDEADAEFPPHLAELVTLHEALLKTLLLQFAHSGNTVPLDIAPLLPHVSRSWGKRAVNLEDVRRCIAIEVSSPFLISDYGRGKVCIELHPGHDAAAIKRDELCRQFKDNLRSLCQEKKTSALGQRRDADADADMDTDGDVDIHLGSLSLANLPRAAISTMGTGVAVAAHPQMAKGQQALSQLRNDMATKQAEKEAKANKQALSSSTTGAGGGGGTADGPKLSLLDRLRLKQLAKSEGPLPPSGPELDRRAALNRVPDVSATISMLSLSSPASLPRQAFTMQVILEKLRDSTRSPLAAEEGARCVRLIAQEVAPEWLRVVKIGGRENVVIQRGAQPVDRVILERVQKLMG